MNTILINEMNQEELDFDFSRTLFVFPFKNIL